MSHRIRILLIQEIPPKGRGKSVPTERVLDEFEVEVEDKTEGVELLECIGTFLEDNHGKELLEEVEE